MMSSGNTENVFFISLMVFFSLHSIFKIAWRNSLTYNILYTFSKNVTAAFM